MARVSRRVQRDVELKRQIVKAHTHEEALLIARSLTAYADALGTVDREFPNPEARDRAREALALAKCFHEANMARAFLEDPNGS